MAEALHRVADLVKSGDVAKIDPAYTRIIWSRTYKDGMSIDHWSSSPRKSIVLHVSQGKPISDDVWRSFTEREEKP